MDKITFKNLKKLLTCQPYFVWHDLPQDEDQDFDLENFWKQDIDYANTSASQVIMSTFSKITDKAKEILKNAGAIEITGDVESRIEQTREAIGTDKIIINPIFQYKDAIAKPLAYDFKNNHVYEIKFSKKTKLMDFMKAYYQIEIINKSILVKDYIFFLPRNAQGQKGIVDLVKDNRVSLAKNGHSYDDTFKSGELKTEPLMQMLKETHKFPMKSIDLYIEQINGTREINEIGENLTKDVTDFGFNPYWNELLEKIGNEWSGFNGKVVSKKSIANKEVKESIVLETLESIDKTLITDEKFIRKELLRITNSSKVVWYDFEGFSLPFPAMDNTKPYQQMVFQLSKIVTDGSVEELEKKNLVWDPKSLSLDDLYEVIEEVYSKGADEYIVYNKGYEIPRLREMCNMLLDDSRYEEANRMVEHIAENTLDLMIFFQINSAKKLPPILLNDQKAKASIKNIEKHISKNKINVGYQIKEYKNLDIQNGVMAMQVGIERATGVMGDREWSNIIDKLKEYCENDVKAMIMVYYYILYLLKND